MDVLREMSTIQRGAPRHPFLRELRRYLDPFVEPRNLKEVEEDSLLAGKAHPRCGPPPAGYGWVPRKWFRDRFRNPYDIPQTGPWGAPHVGFQGPMDRREDEESVGSSRCGLHARSGVSICYRGLHCWEK